MTAKSVYVVSADELSNGTFKLQPGKAVRVRGFAAGDSGGLAARGVAGGARIPVYVVNDTDLATQRGVIGGEPILVSDAATNRGVAGRVAIPVYVENDWPASETYIDRVLATGPVAYWPMSETSGTTADNAEGTAARDGTFARNITAMGTQAGPIAGTTAPTFNGTSDYLNVFSSSLNTAMGNMQTGASAVWVRVSAAGDWSDSTIRSSIFLRDAASQNFMLLRKAATSNQINYLYNANGTLESTNVTTSTTAWFHMGFTWSLANDQTIAYYNGAGQTPTTGMGTFNAALTLALIGANNTSGSNVWKGAIAHAAIWDRVLSAAEIAALATP